jgi:FkbM family methyltransferase
MQHTRLARSIYKQLKDTIYYYKNREKIFLKRSEFFRLRSYRQSEKKDQSTVFNGHEISFTSPFWFLHSIDEIFVQEVYKFSSQVTDPVILDCGANIGLSVIYFKKLYPEARITAFEADSAIFRTLKENIKSYNYSHVSLIHSAVWKERAVLSFFSEGSVGGMIDMKQVHQANMIEVPSIRLRDYLEAKIDFLKIDIEGAEYEVLKDCKDLLVNVSNLFIEYHVLPDEIQTLHEILGWVSVAGFRYYIREAWNNMSYPFLKTCNDYYQMQLNIFCYR